MFSLRYTVPDSLSQAFSCHNLDLEGQPNRIVVKNSTKLTGEEIQKILESAGICSQVTLYHEESDFAFTILPTQNFSYVIQHLNPAIQPTLVQANDQYFFLDELSWILHPKCFVGESEAPVQDKWSPVNHFRAPVASALNKALFDILSPYQKEGRPIIEIGSGIGYSLPEPLFSNTIRIQPDSDECQLLRQSTPSPIYQTDIEGLYSSLIKIGKKISLFFGLNVFDAMDQKERVANLMKLSQLQNPGDKLLIMLDTNPGIDLMIFWLQSLYPGYIVYPYAPFTKNECMPQSVILVPQGVMPPFPHLNDYLRFEYATYHALIHEEVFEMQRWLHKLQKTFNYQVISLEDFFVEQVKLELASLGYTSRSFYHAAFTTGDLPSSTKPFKEDLLYKPVTDSMTLQHRSVDDQIFQSTLAQKGIYFPAEYLNEHYLQELREKHHKILGAEILVIEATKDPVGPV